MLFSILDCASSGGLGLEDESIVKDQLSSSSTNGSEYAEKYGRLNYDDTFGGWQPSSSDSDPWFGVDLLKDGLISGVATQGGVLDDNLRTKKFTMSYSTDGITFAFYKFNGDVKVGNNTFCCIHTKIFIFILN